MNTIVTNKLQHTNTRTMLIAESHKIIIIIIIIIFFNDKLSNATNYRNENSPLKPNSSNYYNSIYLAIQV